MDADVARVLLERDDHELGRHDEVKRAVAREDVPPAVALKQDRQRVADRVARRMQLRAEDIVDVPQEEAEEERQHADELRAARMPTDLAALGRLRELRVRVAQLDDRADRRVRKDRAVRNLVEHGVAVHHVRHGDPRNHRKDADREQEATARPVVARRVFEERVCHDAAAPDHRELVAQLRLVLERHVEEERPEADDAETRVARDEARREALTVHKVHAVQREAHEHKVGEGVHRLGDVVRPHILALAPQERARDGAPVAHWQRALVRVPRHIDPEIS